MWLRYMLYMVVYGGWLLYWKWSQLTFLDSDVFKSICWSFFSESQLPRQRINVYLQVVHVPLDDILSVFCMFLFIQFEKAENKDELNRVLTTFQEGLRSKLNPHNLNRYVQSFMKYVIMHFFWPCDYNIMELLFTT